ncbi:hypothetical protein PMAYCL1PPCAC_07749, partial [Pristionchus mayeri]
IHPCIIHGCDYTTNRRWNFYAHLQRKHQYPVNLLDSMKRSDENRKKRVRQQIELQRGYEFACGWCDLRYPNKKRLHEHMKRKHREKFDGGGTAQVVCPAPGCDHACQTREQLVLHAHTTHATQECPYVVEEIGFDNENDFHEWKEELQKETQSDFPINSSTPSEARPKRVYMWCAKANKSRVSRIPDSERKRFGNYGGRTKRVQSHCTAFITATYFSNGTVSAKFCRYHIGHNQIGMECKSSSRGRRKQMMSQSVEGDSEDDSYIDVGGEGIDHEEYVEDEETMEHPLYSDEEEEEAEKKRVIRFLTATDRMRPERNPSYAMEEEYEEEEEAVLPQRTLRYVHPGGPRLAYPRPVRPHMRNDDVKSEADATEFVHESYDRVMRAVRTRKHNYQLQHHNPPIIHHRRVQRGSIKNQEARDVKLEPREELYDLDPEDVVQEEEVVEEEGGYVEEPGTSYEVHDYYQSISSN